MHIFHVFLTIFCLNLGCESKSVIQQNDTALELLNNCKCTLREHCYKGYLNVRGVGIITLRTDVKNHTDLVETVDIQCSNLSQVCCKEWRDEIGNRLDDTLGQHKDTKPSKLLLGQKDNSKAGKSQSKCGKAKPTINIRIFTAEDDITSAVDGEFPWISSIHRKNQLDDSFQFRCGGSLLTDLVVLTAAHCVYSSRKKPSELKIIANARKELGRVGLVPSDERAVKKILVHPDYYSAGAHNDLALIFLEQSYNESKDLNSICLPDGISSYDSQRCLAAGWGQGNGKSDNGDKILSKVELPLVDHKSCRDQLRTTRLGSDFQLHESAICAGGKKGRDTCKGDGGGPLICPNGEGRFIQVGIVSWGVDCSRKGLPGVYTNVEKFVDWIQDSIRENLEH